MRARPVAPWGATACLAALALVGCVLVVLALRGPAEPASPGAAEWGAVPTAASPPAGPGMSASPPSRLDIPAVDIHTRLLRLGLNEDGTLEVPWRPLLAGWYVGSPSPGEQGPAIVAGHLDSVETGPAVFYRLAELTTGDRIVVSRQDGTRAEFRVTAVRSYAQADFPTETVYGDTAGPTLRLITCTDWDEQAEEYVGNVVVFADLVVTGSSGDHQ